MQRTPLRIAVPFLAFCIGVCAEPMPAQDQPQPSQDNSAITPIPRTGRQLDRHKKINGEVAAKQGAVDLVFIGDSITQGWRGRGKAVWAEHYANRRAVNLGIGGDRTEHVLWRLANGNLEGIEPKVAVVMIGTNNFGQRKNTPSQILAGVQAVVADIRERSPKTRVLLLDIFPRGEGFNPMRGGIAQVNQALSRLDDGEHVTFLPIGHHFIEDDGSIDKSIMPDFLHLTAEGYGRWAQAIEPTLKDLMTRDTRARTHKSGAAIPVPVDRRPDKTKKSSSK